MSHIKLPHINLIQYYQFITFRTYDSIDNYVHKLQESDIDTKLKQYKIDKYLDTSKNGAYFYGKQIDIMKNILFEKNNIDYQLETFCIMPNHIHILLKQLTDLKTIMQHIKGKSSIKLNKILNKKGKFWLDGYFDKAIRNERHYTTTYEYILNNPIKANLKDSDLRIYTKYSLD